MRAGVSVTIGTPVSTLTAVVSSVPGSPTTKQPDGAAVESQNTMPLSMVGDTAELARTPAAAILIMVSTTAKSTARPPNSPTAVCQTDDRSTGVETFTPNKTTAPPGAVAFTTPTTCSSATVELTICSAPHREMYTTRRWPAHNGFVVPHDGMV